MSVSVCKVNSKESINKFVWQCQDLMMRQSTDQSFDYVYITEENTKRLLTFIECMSKRDDRFVLTHALTQVFTDFLVKDASAAVLEIVKVNEELRLTWDQISKVSKSKIDLENTYARLQTSRSGGDILATLSKHITEPKHIGGMKVDDYVLNSPFVKTANDTVLAELNKHLNEICVDVYNGYKIHSPNYHYVDTTTENWFILHHDDYLSNQHVDKLIRFAVKYDLNGEYENEYEFSVVDRMDDDLFY